jgi:mono/diheme cytochrome c family protein
MAKFNLSTAPGAFALGVLGFAPQALADDLQTARGHYLVIVAGCSDCHTPGALIGAPDMKRYLAGSNIGFSIPGQGVFVGQNLTPDKETGLGQWTSEQIVAAIRAGKKPDGGQLSPVMPYNSYAHLTDADASAIVAFLQSLTPVNNKNLGPFPPSEKVPVFVSAVLPADVYNALPAPKK